MNHWRGERNDENGDKMFMSESKNVLPWDQAQLNDSAGYCLGQGHDDFNLFA